MKDNEIREIVKNQYRMRSIYEETGGSKEGVYRRVSVINQCRSKVHDRYRPEKYKQIPDIPIKWRILLICQSNRYNTYSADQIGRPFHLTEWSKEIFAGQPEERAEDEEEQALEIPGAGEPAQDEKCRNAPYFQLLAQEEDNWSNCHENNKIPNEPKWIVNRAAPGRAPKDIEPSVLSKRLKQRKRNDIRIEAWS